jgi:hypothetical protein
LSLFPLPAHPELRLLAVGHYVLAGLSALFCLFPVLYMGLGLAFVRMMPEGPRGPPAAFGWIFVVVGLIGLLLGIAYVVLLLLAARALAAQRRWMLVMVSAGLCCANVPLGTVLGVFTLVTLQKPQVRALFGEPVAPVATWGPPLHQGWPPPPGWGPPQGPPGGSPPPPA